MFRWITETIETLGYGGIAALAFIENVFPPIGREHRVVRAGATNRQKRACIDGSSNMADGSR
jgi:membrane protein DedA with SNARE-associated domain